MRPWAKRRFVGLFGLGVLLAGVPIALSFKSQKPATVDIAEMNLVCAAGLQGSENHDVAKCLARLDEWAKRARYWTDQSMWDFRQHPEKFKNSEAKFRVLLLISVLQKDFGVHYNDRGERNCDCSNSKNPFIHGMIDDPNGGTCASMPVLYVAVGRRLGYPMKLVLAKTHVFARWDDGKERFNIEGTNAQFADHPDSYYQNWPDKITEAELKQGWYLKPLTPGEELALFLENRGNCLMDNGRFQEAKAAFTQAARLAPQDPLGQWRIASAAEAMRPVPAGPSVRWVPGKGYVDEDGVPFAYPDPMADVERINAMNRANMERLARPPQPGVHQPSNPYGPANPYGPQSPYQPGRP
jgi:tetratricopeptide (TPR) repeat protein